ncbi:MAG: hypothetical protein AAGH79_08440 [Bacteroidota bacterium]
MSKEERKDPFDGEYVGNIWGWKNSFIGLGIIVFMGIFILIREMTVGIENRARLEEERQQRIQDSLLELERLDTLQ